MEYLSRRNLVARLIGWVAVARSVGIQRQEFQLRQRASNFGLVALPHDLD
jgi:hypothetical protein